MRYLNLMVLKKAEFVSVAAALIFDVGYTRKCSDFCGNI
jgi:hypothetical protein